MNLYSQFKEQKQSVPREKQDECKSSDCHQLCFFCQQLNDHCVLLRLFIFALGSSPQ